MIIEFNQGNNPAAVLGDDLAQVASNRISVALERLGGQATTEAVPMADAANQLLLTHGNVAGDLVFSATQSFASRTDAMNYLFAQYALLGWQDMLSFTWDGAQWYFQEAMLKNVERVPHPGSDGVKLSVRYTFQVAQITNTQNAI